MGSDDILDRIVGEFFDTGRVVLNETTDTINWDKIGKVIRDPNKSEQIYELLIDMFPNAKEVIDYNYYGDNEEPSPNDTFAEMKSFLWNIDKNTIKGPDLRLSTGFEIDGEYKKDLEKKYDDYVGGKIDKYFRDSSNDPRDTTKEGFKSLPPILVMGKKVIDGNHRTFLAQKVGAELSTFEMVEEPNTHPNAQKILSIIHPNDSDEDGIPNRLDISQEPNLNEYNNILDRIVEEFYDTGKLVLNEFTTNSPEMTKLRGDYYKILTGEVEEIEVGNLFDQWDNLTSTQRSSFEDINGLFDFETKLELLRNNIDLIKEITNTFNHYKDIDFLRELKDVKILYDLRDKIDGLAEEIKEFLPDNIIRLIDDKIDEVESVELIPHETSVTQEINRLNQVEEDNNSDLALLSMDTPIATDSEKSNLMTLQNLLLDKYVDDDYKSKLEEEKEKGVFGEVTEFHVQLLQSAHNMEESGIVNRRVWDVILGLISQDETNKLDNIGVSDDLKDILSFQYGRNMNNKEKLNKLSFLELFNNLVNFEVYKIEHQRSDDDILNDLNKEVEKFFVNEYPEVTIFERLEKELESKNSIINNFKTNWIIRNPKKPLSNFFKNRKIKDILEDKKKIVKNIEKYKKLEPIIRKFNGGGPIGKNARQEYLDKRKKTDERTVKGLFDGLKKVFDNAIEVKDYSLDAINTILTKINLTLKKTYERDITQTTKNNKSKKALRSIMDKVDNVMDVEDIQDTLDNINTKTFQHVKYELSFCECRNDDDEMLRPYFRDCGSSIGNKSRLLPNNNLLKELIDSESDWEECVNTLYRAIIGGEGRRIQKHDITANIDVLYDDGGIIDSGSTIEVKMIKDSSKVRESGHILSEFLSLYKNEPDRTNYLIPEKYNKYNKIIEGLVNRLNENDGGIISEFDSTGGIFLKDYMFYPRGTYRLEWSTDSERAQIKAGEGREEDEKRLSVKFIITGEGYQWEEGNCNIEGGQPTNESTDRIDNIIENFFDTGNFDI